MDGDVRREERVEVRVVRGQLLDGAAGAGTSFAAFGGIRSTA